MESDHPLLHKFVQISTCNGVFFVKHVFGNSVSLVKYTEEGDEIDYGQCPISYIVRDKE